MVERIMKKDRYILVGVITALIFLLGITFGMILDNYRLQWSEKTNQEQQINYDGLQLQYLYLSALENSSEACPILRAALETSIAELSFSLSQVEKYEQDTTLNNQQYNLIMRKYLQDNLRYWIFSQRVKKMCNDDVINILYFFSKDHCEICPNQGTILTYFKKKLEDKLLVFPINSDLEKDEEFIKILKIRYNITSYPTIIVNDDKYEGVVGKDELSRIICEESADKEKCMI